MMDVGMTTNDSKISKDTTEPSMIRVHTPSPVSRAYPGHLPVPGSTPAITDLDAIDYDSGNDTEPEDSSSNPQSSLGAFKSFLTYHTAASSLNSSPLNANPPNTIPSIPFLNALNLRRSISADRLTMRPTPPPLIRTQSDSPSVHSAPSSSIPTLASLHNPLHSLSSLTLPGVRVSGNDGGADINTLLNAFCGDHVYISQPNGPIYTENVETKMLMELVNAPGAHIPTEDPPRLTALEKGKGRADDNLDQIYDSDAYLSATSDSEPTSGTSPYRPCYPQLNDTTDDELRYGTIPDSISDSEDIDISAYIDTTATMPAFPAPTVSRSRSSSRSCPNHLFTGDIPPVPPIPAHALLGGQPPSLSTSRLASSPIHYSPVQDNRALQAPTPTQTLPPTPSSASISSTTSFSSTAALNPRLKPPAPPANEKSRQRSVSESGGGSGSGSGSGSRGRFARIAQVLRKSPSVSPGRGIEHIAPPPARKSKNRPKFTIAFIGSAGCGKTSIIENASHSANPKFKQETTKRTVCYNSEDIHIQLREVATVVDKSRSTTPVTAVETDSAPFLRALDGNAEFWPDSLPAIDAVVLCYDASREGNQGGSFDGIQRLNDAFAARRTPIIWVGCKSDWIRVPNKDNQGPGSPRILPDGIVPPNEVFVKALASHTGLIEVTQESSYGIEQMRNSFTWMYKSAARLLRDREQSSTGDGCLNHASPEVLDRKSSQKSTRSRPIVPRNRPPIPHPPFQPSSSANPPTNTSHSPTMLQPHSRPVTRARSMSDLLSQEARDRVAEPSAAIVRKASATMTAHISRSTEETRNDQPEEPETKAEDGAGTRTSEHNISVLVLPPKFRQDKYAFMTVDDMIVRLSGGMVPGWDIQFNQNFMMTFRRFATPREVLVGMVLRLRTTTDEEEKRRAVLILFDYLLEWTFKYPQDFATPGAIAPFISLIGLFKNKFSHEGAPSKSQGYPSYAAHILASRT
ncbi:hypothetical protein FRC12_001291 [Ceratobasidium sp. 428]|nr:hypothetical protein FRC12_001291 [Ceratobasidium sp. 428]